MFVLASPEGAQVNDDLFDSDELTCAPTVGVVCTNPLRAEPSAAMVTLVKQWGLLGLILGAIAAGAVRIFNHWRRRILSP